jgi:SAM-dependent methyltransferase
MIYNNYSFPGKFTYFIYRKNIISFFLKLLMNIFFYGNDNIKRTRNNLKFDTNKLIYILDFGCGTGETSCLIAKSYPNSVVYGYDNSPKQIRNANMLKKVLKLKNIFFTNKNIFNYKNLKFDFIQLSGVLHHVKGEVKFLHKLKNLLNPKSEMRNIYFGVYGRKFFDEKYLRFFIQKILKVQNANKCLKFLKTIGIDRSKELLKIKKENRFFKLLSSLFYLNFSYLGYLFFPHIKNSNNIDAYFHYYVKYYTPELIINLLKKIKCKKKEFILPSTKYDHMKFYKNLNNKNKFLFLESIGKQPSYTIKCTY